MDSLLKNLEKNFIYKKSEGILGATYGVHKNKGSGEFLRCRLDSHVDMFFKELSLKESCSIMAEEVKKLLIITYCCRGKKVINFEDKNEINAGRVLYFRAVKNFHLDFKNFEGITYFIDIDRLADFLNFTTRGVAIEKWIDRICPMGEIVVKETPKVMGKVIHKIRQREIKDIVDYIRIKESLMDFLIELINLQLEESEDYKLVKSVEDIVLRDLSSSIPLRALAKNLNTSIYKLQKSFKKIKGTTVSNFIRRLKMERGKIYLKDLDLSIIDIAQNLGYENPSKFAKAFKDHTGKTPTEYRNHWLI